MVNRRRSVFVAFFLWTSSFAGPPLARANFAPPPSAGEQRVEANETAGGAPPDTSPQPAPASGEKPAAAAAAPTGGDQAAPAPVAAAAVTEKPAPVVAPLTAPPPRSAAMPEVDDEESLRAFADENPAPRSRLNVAAWVGTGVTVALLGVAAFYAAKAGEKASDVDRLTRNFDPATDLPAEYAPVADQYTAAMRDGKHDERVAKGFAIAAGATALTSAVLFIIDAVRKPDDDGGGKNHAMVTPIVTAQGAGLGLGGTF